MGLVAQMTSLAPLSCSDGAVNISTVAVFATSILCGPGWGALAAGVLGVLAYGGPALWLEQVVLLGILPYWIYRACHRRWNGMSVSVTLAVITALRFISLLAFTSAPARTIAFRVGIEAAVTWIVLYGAIRQLQQWYVSYMEWISEKDGEWRAANHEFR